MRIDLPRCNFKNCRWCFDSNCVKPEKREYCDFVEQQEKIAELSSALVALDTQSREARESNVAVVQNLVHSLKSAKTEAYAEFADRLKESFDVFTDDNEADAIYIRGLIEDTLKELTEENKNG